MQNNTFHKNPKIFITDGDKILNILTDLLVAPKDKERFEQFIRPDNILERMRCKKEVIYLYISGHSRQMVYHIYRSSTIS